MFPKTKCLKILNFLCLSSALLLQINSVAAATEFRFEQNTETKSVSEGYLGDLDKLQQERELARHARALADTGGEESAAYSNLTAHPSGHPGFFYDHGDVYIVSVGTSIYSDLDQDGFFSKFSLRFDADVSYGEEDVYAQIYLRNDRENYQLFHTSQVFEIYESLGGDEYELDSRLVSNYTAAYYDIRVELRDAHTDELYDMVDASTHRTLSGLPLESSELNGVDTQSQDFLDGDGTDGRREQVVTEHVGASYALLPSLFLMALLRRRLRR